MWCFAKKILHESCRMSRRIVVMKLICSLGHCECDGHTAHKLGQRRLTADRLVPRESGCSRMSSSVSSDWLLSLTADWLVPRESGCSRMRSSVSSDWLPSYIKATRPVLEIFQMDGYFPDSPRTVYFHWYRCPTHSLYCNLNTVSLVYLTHIVGHFLSTALSHKCSRLSTTTVTTVHRTRKRGPSHTASWKRRQVTNVMGQIK